MATIKLMNGDELQIPEARRLTERGVAWEERDETHLVPWTAIREFIEPWESGGPDIVTPPVDRL